MPTAKRSYLILALLMAALLLSYSTPRKKYVSPGILKTIHLPDQTGSWSGENFENNLRLGEGLLTYLSDIKTKKYLRNGQVLYVTLMDAGNFHHPKLCFTGSGYTAEDLQDTTFQIQKRSFKAPTVFFKKPNESILVMYWLCVDQERVNWAQQKTREFWYALLGKKRTGFIVRLDIPTLEQDIPAAVQAAQNLVESLAETIPPDQAAYIFGKN